MRGIGFRPQVDSVRDASTRYKKESACYMPSEHYWLACCCSLNRRSPFYR